jgi:DNA-binding NtrC family response regulator
VRVDVRVLAATNRDLQAMVRQGQFREDLYYRMSTISLELPPLRKRGADVELLAKHFVALMNERFESSRQISEEALRTLRRHTWPGNVRELLHAVEGAMVVCEGPEILPQHLPQSVRGSIGKEHSAVSYSPNGTDKFPTLEELETSHIHHALQISGGHRGNAARILGISERNLYRKLRELGLLPEGHSGAST